MPVCALFVRSAGRSGGQTEQDTSPDHALSGELSPLLRTWEGSGSRRGHDRVRWLACLEAVYAQEAGQVGNETLVLM